MSPNVTFQLDAEGYNRCADLLEAAGIHFVSQRPEIHGPFPSTPAVTFTFGKLTSPYGTFHCKLIKSENQYTLVVSAYGEIGILDDLERAFTGHLLDKT